MTCFSSDFSGRCGPRQMQGYATKTEYEMLGDGVVKETPQNKFNRLQHEIRELAEELEQIKVCLKKSMIKSNVFQYLRSRKHFPCFCIIELVLEFYQTNILNDSNAAI